MNEWISVVIPVYKTEKTLERCVRSVLAQSYRELDVILVDDGSPDESGALCDRLAAQDERLSVIHKPNGGVARARFDGVRAAKGKYVTFVDSDDEIDPDCVQALYSAIHEFDAQAATCGYHYCENGAVVRDRFVFDGGTVCLSAEGTFQRMLYDSCCSMSLWGKLYVTEKLRAIEPPDLVMGEDTYVCLRYLMDCRRIAHTGQAKYSYHQNTSSAVHTYDGRKYYDYVRLYDLLAGEFAEKFPTCQTAYINRCAENNFMALLKLSASETPDREKYEHIRENLHRYRKTVIFDRKAEKRTRIACLLSYAGLPAVTKAYSLFQSIKK